MKHKYFVIEDTKSDDGVISSAATLKEARRLRDEFMAEDPESRYAITSRERGVIDDFRSQSDWFQ